MACGLFHPAPIVCTDSARLCPAFVTITLMGNNCIGLRASGSFQTSVKFLQLIKETQQYVHIPSDLSPWIYHPSWWLTLRFWMWIIGLEAIPLCLCPFSIKSISKRRLETVVEMQNEILADKDSFFIYFCSNREDSHSESKLSQISRTVWLLCNSSFVGLTFVKYHSEL